MRKLNAPRGTLRLDCGSYGEAIEGAGHLLTCQGLRTGDTVWWIKLSDVHGNISIANCTGDTTCLNKYQDKYEVTRVNETSQLQISRVVRDNTFVEGVWMCYTTTEESHCSIKTVYPPDLGQCQVRFDNTKQKVIGECEIHKIFPKPVCDWFQQILGSNKTSVPSTMTPTTVTPYVNSAGLTYFRSSCDMELPLPTREGVYFYLLQITPGYQTHNLTFTSTNIVRAPGQPQLLNCPITYVVSTDVASCTCNTSDLGSPRGSLSWRNPEGTTFVEVLDTTLTLRFTDVAPQYNGRPYRCTVNHYTQSKDVEFTPRIAESPGSPFIDGFFNDYKVNDELNMTCSSRGGIPPIQRVYFACAGQSDMTDMRSGELVTSLLTFRMSDSYRDALCVCFADNGVYTTKNITITLKMAGTDNSPAKNDNTVNIIVGVVVGVAGVITLAVIFGIYLKRKSLCDNTPYDSLSLTGLVRGSSTMSEPGQANESNGEQPPNPVSSSDVRNDPNNDFSGDDTNPRPNNRGVIYDNRKVVASKEQMSRTPENSTQSDLQTREEELKKSDRKRDRPIPSRPGSSGKLGDQTGRAPQKSKHSDSSRRKEQGTPSEAPGQFEMEQRSSDQVLAQGLSSTEQRRGMCDSLSSIDDGSISDDTMTTSVTTSTAMSVGTPTPSVTTSTAMSVGTPAPTSVTPLVEVSLEAGEFQTSAASSHI
ncbi:hypothetical protein C0Q70_08069 [Pomacea canaliculata]|uniref:Ig-like domain-containing protein n=1 Tax=Pomacea canaliculata TaxID=400727 RepID=A0A2T7PGS4_POMCA|nr:hypothetical protein C0Q70_08069 [Pomacea canaliculata]